YDDEDDDRDDGEDDAAHDHLHHALLALDFGGDVAGGHGRAVLAGLAARDADGLGAGGAVHFMAGRGARDEEVPSAAAVERNPSHGRPALLQSLIRIFRGLFRSFYPTVGRLGNIVGG